MAGNPRSKLAASTSQMMNNLVFAPQQDAAPAADSATATPATATAHPARAAAALRLPRLSPQEALARTAIAQRARDLALCAANGWRITLVPMPLSDSAAPDAGTPSAPLFSALRWSDCRFDLFCAPEMAERFLLENFGALPATEGSPVLRLIAFEYWMQDFLRQSGLAVRGMPETLPHNATAPATALPFRYHWHAHGPGASAGLAALSGELHSDTAGHLLLAKLLNRPSMERPTPRTLAHVRLPQRLKVGHTRLTRRAFSALRPYDVLLVQASQWHERVLHITAGPGLAWHARCEGQHLVVTRGLHTIMEYANEPNLDADDTWSHDDAPPAHEQVSRPSASAPAPYAEDDDEDLLSGEPSHQAVLDALERVPVTLEFDLGDCEMTLSQLRSLTPGSVLDLERPVSQAVSIRANGTLLGTGELVEIDGRIGVSIVRIALEEDAS
ncbi:type III secretion system cytoplasmic ring protein SctQ [Paraburkholderia hayleyella]|uniref:type III secretion system cytoplasmic ring protein SctQ n=1 Tax=Paraburkholderia hayleyella TaxID=2152889 RepID=UPI0015809E1B|nr:type III secretion system cytoplasmic ring protein SctQ [Paraburkholderia hayleyella]